MLGGRETQLEPWASNDTLFYTELIPRSWMYDSICNHRLHAVCVHGFGNYRINPLAFCLPDSSVWNHIALGPSEQ